jgi:hypothetical protein
MIIKRKDAKDGAVRKTNNGGNLTTEKLISFAVPDVPKGIWNFNVPDFKSGIICCSRCATLTSRTAVMT